jgi:hypothetical protein
MSKLREVTVPLPIESIKEFFQDKEIKFLVDYTNSKIKDQVFLTYVSNLDIPIDIKDEEGLDQETLFKLLDCYMTVKTITDIPFLNSIVTQIILTAAGSKHAAENGYLSKDQLEEFINTRKETIALWLAFFNSLPLYLMSTFDELNEKIKVKENNDVIDDADIVGLNVVNLIKRDIMLEFFAQQIDAKQFWFTQQFESYMFKGKSLYTFVEPNMKAFYGLMLAGYDGKLNEVVKVKETA